MYQIFHEEAYSKVGLNGLIRDKLTYFQVIFIRRTFNSHAIVQGTTPNAYPKHLANDCSWKKMHLINALGLSFEQYGNYKYVEKKFVSNEKDEQ